MDNTVYPLFPYPLLVCGQRYPISATESAFISGLEMIDNTGNLMSASDKVLECRELAGLKSFLDEQIFNFKKTF